MSSFVFYLSVCVIACMLISIRLLKNLLAGGPGVENSSIIPSSLGLKTHFFDRQGLPGNFIETRLE